MRWTLVVVGSLIALLGSRANAQGACEGVDAVYDLKDNLNAREITLGLTSACGGTDGVQFRIPRNPSPQLNTRNAKVVLLKGTPQMKTEELGPTEVFRFSRDDMKNDNFGADKALKMKVWPGYGDSDLGFYLLQQGEKNWVEYKIPEFYKLKGINIYETLNPGGVTGVELLTERDAYTVWSKTKPNGDNGFQTTVSETAGLDKDGKETGSRKLTFNFETPKFTPTLVRLWIDASKEWRGIDFVGLFGVTQEFPPLPGNLLDDKLVIQPNRNWGCDVFTYQVKKTEWSAGNTIRVCYGAPEGPNGKVCSGNGTPEMGECKCQASPKFKGADCATPECPGEDGRGGVCNGRGKCGGAADPRHTCSCDPAFTGPGCVWQKFSSHCHFVGDPHWATFDHYYSGDRTYYNLYNEGEYLDFYMNDKDLNPDEEAIAHYQTRPWPGSSIVAATNWVVFRKGNEFVKVFNSGDIRLGVQGGNCFTANIASLVDAAASQGRRGYDTDAGLRISRHGPGWRIASEVPGKNPTNTVLIVYNQWLYMDSYVFISTARVGKALGMCGDFDGKGNDLGNYWRHAEPSETVSESLRIPASKSFDKCRGAGERPVAINLLEDSIKISPKLSLAETLEAAKYVTRGGSDAREGITPAMVAAASRKGRANSAPVTLVEVGKAKSESVEDALAECANKGVNANDYPKLEAPRTRAHLALSDCFNRLLSKSPANEAGDEISRNAKLTAEGAKAALSILDRFPQWASTKANYLDCIDDVCASGVLENWIEVSTEDNTEDTTAKVEDAENIDETSRIEGKDLRK